MASSNPHRSITDNHVEAKMDGRVLDVANLHPTTGRHNLRQSLYDRGIRDAIFYWSEPVLPHLPHHRGYVHIEFSTKNEADTALAQLQDWTVRHRRLIVTRFEYVRPSRWETGWSGDENSSIAPALEDIMFGELPLEETVSRTTFGELQY
jgi:hypothetical protein